jgi:trigger factor
VKSAVETLNPTRIRLTVEVPFEELKPSLDAAYKKINQQVNVPGFRRGKVPARIIDQRFGRGVVLKEAVDEALPHFYGQAVEENKVQVLGQPELGDTEFSDGSDLKFTVEVEIRPEIDLPDYKDIEITVDDAAVDDADVDRQLQTLRERFAVLSGVDRPAQQGDYVSLDLEATIEGEAVEDANATGASYEIGSGTLVDGLDDAVIGLSAGESATFTSTLRGGTHADQQAEVTATVRSVKAKELPELDDEFAQSASEFDTLEELRASTRTRQQQMKRFEQMSQARDRILEAMLSRVDVPLPEKLLASEIELRKQNIEQQLALAGMSKESYLLAEQQTAEEFDAEIARIAREGMKAQFLLDALAAKEQLSVSEADLTQHLIQRAAGSGLTPDQFAQQVVQSGQVPVLVGEVVRSKALAILIESAKVTDESGQVVDLKALESGASTGEIVTNGAEEVAAASADAEDLAETPEVSEPTGEQRQEAESVHESVKE